MICHQLFLDWFSFPPLRGFSLRSYGWVAGLDFPIPFANLDHCGLVRHLVFSFTVLRLIPNAGVSLKRLTGMATHRPLVTDPARRLLRKAKLWLRKTLWVANHSPDRLMACPCRVCERGRGKRFSIAHCANMIETFGRHDSCWGSSEVNPPFTAFTVLRPWAHALLLRQLLLYS